MTQNKPTIPPKAPNEMYTDAQWQAIYDQGDNLLVSASAGSGKTAVLVRRVIEKIKRERLSVDELLVVTFTEAAASEMKERVQGALQEAVNEETDQELKNHFTRQLTLLPMANISTLHSFCSKVIQRFFYLIDLDPSYRMLTDATETILLKEDVWDELREECYEQNEEIFYRLTENFSNDRSDQGLEDLILSMYEFARANPAPFEWLDSLLENYSVNELTESTLYQESLRPQLLQALEDASELYQEMMELSEGSPDLEKIFSLAEQEKQATLALLQALHGDQLSEAHQLMDTFSFPTFPTPRKKEVKELYGETIDRLKDKRQTAKDLLTNMKTGFFAATPEEHIERLHAARPLVEELVRVEKLFISRYSAKKREKGLLDFNDLEHFTLQILKTEVEGEFPAQKHYRNRFEEVLVDEYQDINQLQETILRSLATETVNEGNLFMVGDVKQSIYGFRLADPTLFIQKYHDFADKKGGRRIILAENFRSRKEVLDFTNLVFKQLMDEEVGQIAYDQEAELINGFTAFPESDSFKAEMLVYEKDEEAPEWIEDKTAGEVIMVAAKIRELIHEGFEIYDKKQKAMRPIDYQDIVLLTPTKSNNLTILEIFKQLDIPLAINDTQNYFQSTELRVMIALLQIIDNPYQDIPLAAVLRSPMVGLTEEELAQVRLLQPKKEFYRAMKQYIATKEDKTSEKLRDFSQLFINWREYARQEALSDLVTKIYDETAYLDYVLGMPAGQQRHANLLALVERAKDYERSSFRGLYQFIRFIEKMQEKDKDLAEPQSEEITNAVRVMTIHASKGLEFPVVFVMDMSKAFNLSDTRRSYVFDEKLGLGVKYLTPETRVRFTTLAFDAVQQVNMRKLLSEEMRKLYVALTRAEQKLFLVGSYSNQEDALKKWSATANNPELVLPVSSRTRGTFFDWVGQTLIRHPEMQEYQLEGSIAPQAEVAQQPAEFAISFVLPNTLGDQITKFMPAKKEQAEVKEATADISQVKKRLLYQYEFPEATKTTSYQSVSELKRMYDDPDNREAISLNFDEKGPQQAVYRFTEDGLNQPKFLETKSQLSAAEIGTATHLIMQLIPLDKQPTEQKIQNLIDELVAGDTLTQELAEAISIDSLLAFFASELGQLVLAHASQVYREEPFAMLLPANEVFMEYEAKDDILIHGIIDGYIEFEDYLVLYDFKTDYYTPQREKELVDRYRGQLLLYKEAIEKAKNKPVASLNIVFLRGEKVIDLIEN
ncbi:helicase-exonuclease AddAB subunit AddA [Enterococcus sp. 669A]|uniref:ATP-dependent helicase/nuclease subunit A n=1 Tax=Candidatus Enterococcus moelleringii TaxID=2815325 RepID=A0ABS3LBE4_9ENTE|nr:helicase-exonuclease AddAB subunit AddA [Enterococcus sp. 669A]MBO1306941.1 helicase-exonuclease AddAB subunit AddA [Enterococcus sp. 669A]